jgi:hypothetical protein
MPTPRQHLRCCTHAHPPAPARQVPNETPGQDPEGGSECEFALDRSGDGSEEPASPAGEPNALHQQGVRSRSHPRHPSPPGCAQAPAPAPRRPLVACTPTPRPTHTLPTHTPHTPRPTSRTPHPAQDRPMLPRDNPGLGSMLDLRSLSQSLSERAKTPPALGEAQQQLLESPAPSSFMRRPLKHTADALKEHRLHEHLGMHPYRVVLSEVRLQLGWAAGAAGAVVAGAGWGCRPRDGPG